MREIAMGEISLKGLYQSLQNRNALWDTLHRAYTCLTGIGSMAQLLVPVENQLSSPLLLCTKKVVEFTQSRAKKRHTLLVARAEKRLRKEMDEASVASSENQSLADEMIPGKESSADDSTIVDDSGSDKELSQADAVEPLESPAEVAISDNDSPSDDVITSDNELREEEEVTEHQSKASPANDTD